MKQLVKSACPCFLLGLVIGNGCSIIDVASIKTGQNITGVFLDVARINHDSRSNGDTWDHIWADEGNLYSFGCEGRGYGVSNRNVNHNKLAGTSGDSLTGSIVNSMDDYGKGGQQIPNRSNWKVTGAGCIDGVFYAFIADNSSSRRCSWVRACRPDTAKADQPRPIG